MANFSININQNIIPVYTRTINSRTYNLCGGPIDNSYVVSLINDGELIDSQLPLLNTYTGPGLKTLHLTQISASDTSTLKILYDSVPLVTNVTVNIDITGLTPSSIIPLLVVQLTSSVSTADTLFCNISITDINDVTYPVVLNRLMTTINKCAISDEPAFSGGISIVANSHCTDGQTKAFGIQATPYSTIRLRYLVIDSGNHGLTGFLYQTDTYNGTDVAAISGLSGSTGYTKDILINMGSSGTKYFRACVEARPPIIMEDNVVFISLTLRNNANTGDIGVVSLTDTFTI